MHFSSSLTGTRQTGWRCCNVTNLARAAACLVAVAALLATVEVPLHAQSHRHRRASATPTRRPATPKAVRHTVRGLSLLIPRDWEVLGDTVSSTVGSLLALAPGENESVIVTVRTLAGSPATCLEAMVASARSAGKQVTNTRVAGLPAHEVQYADFAGDPTHGYHRIFYVAWQGHSALIDCISRPKAPTKWSEGLIRTVQIKR